MKAKQLVCRAEKAASATLNATTIATHAFSHSPSPMPVTDDGSENDNESDNVLLTALQSPHCACVGFGGSATTKEGFPQKHKALGAERRARALPRCQCSSAPVASSHSISAMPDTVHDERDDGEVDNVLGTARAPPRCARSCVKAKQLVCRAEKAASATLNATTIATHAFSHSPSPMAVTDDGSESGNESDSVLLTAFQCACVGFGGSATTKEGFPQKHKALGAERRARALPRCQCSSAPVASSHSISAIPAMQENVREK